jgi:hypothetical protein
MAAKVSIKLWVNVAEETKTFDLKVLFWIFVNKTNSR